MMRLLPLLVWLLAGLLPARAVQAQMPATRTVCQDACDERCLAEATRLYEFAFFDDAIEEVEPCLRPQPRFGSRELNTRAYRLVALSYFEQGDLDVSRYWIEQLMKADRTYGANETDPAFFRQEVDAARPVRLYRRAWIWGPTVTALAAGGLACVLTECYTSDPASLPLPPDFPRPDGR